MADVPILFGAPGTQGPIAVSRRLVAAISLGLVLLSALIFWNRAVTPSDGTVVQLSNAPFHSDRMTLTFVLDTGTGLRDGDVVTAIDGIPLRSYALATAAHKGDFLTYSVLRHGRPAQITIRLGDFPILGFLARSWSSLAVLFILLSMAIFVFHRRAADPAAQALILIASLTFCGALAWLLGDQAFRLATNGPTILDITGELSLAMIWGAVFCI